MRRATNGQGVAVTTPEPSAMRPVVRSNSSNPHRTSEHAVQTIEGLLEAILNCTITLDHAINRAGAAADRIEAIYAHVAQVRLEDNIFEKLAEAESLEKQKPGSGERARKRIAERLSRFIMSGGGQ